MRIPQLLNSLGTKIGAGYISLFLVFLVIMLFSYRQVSSVEEMVKGSVMEKADARNVSNSIVLECFQTLTFVDEFISASDRSRRLALRIIIDDEIRTVQEYMRQIAGRSLTKVEKEKFALVSSAFDGYTGVLRRVLDADGDSARMNRTAAEGEFHDSHEYLVTELLSFNNLESNLMYESWEYARTKIGLIKTYALVFIIMAFIVSLMLGFTVTRSITRPILRLVRVLRSFGAGDYAARAEVGSRDEIGVMADTFNAMCGELEKSNRKLMDIIEFQPDATVVLDCAHCVMAWNRAMELLSGVPKSEMIGKGNYEYALPFYGERRPIVADMVLEQREDISHEYPVFRRNGITIFAETFVTRLHGGRGAYLSITASPLFDAAGNLIGAIESLRDISERKRTEALLLQEKERLSVTLRSMGEGVVAADENGVIGIMNRIAEKLTGWRMEETVGMKLYDVFRVADRATGERCFPDGGKIDYAALQKPGRKFSLTSKDSGEKAVDFSIAPIFDSDSREIGTIVVFQDVSDRERTEAELLKTQKLESLGIFAGGIAHDFNNILMGVIGGISLLKIEHKDAPEILCRLDDIEKASFRAKELTQQLLTFSKGGDPIKKTVDVVKLLRESANFVLSGSNVRCEFSISDGLPPVEADEGQISQVINNLLINANQAMPDGGIINIAAEAVRSGPDTAAFAEGAYVRISIEDHGTGISGENLGKIFDPFFTTKPKGNGLGLSTSYSIIQKHGGLLSAESMVGKGSVFRIYLPVSGSVLQPGEMPAGTVRLNGRRVLLMDDDEMILQVGAEMLRYLGCEVACSRDGVEAIAVFRKAAEAGVPFDAVIMDLTIPAGMGGREAVTELKKIDPRAAAVVSSGYSNDPVIADYREYGFSGYIVKPYKLEELSEVIWKVTSP